MNRLFTALAVALLLVCTVSAQVAVAPAEYPKLQFFNKSGTVCSACTISTYAGGTTTPLATYTDSTGTVTNSTTITLDSAGYPPNQIWLAASTYKFVLKDSLGATINTVDNIPSNATVARTNFANVWPSLQTFNGGITGVGNTGGLTLGSGALAQSYSWAGAQTSVANNNTQNASAQTGSDIGAQIAKAIAAKGSGPCEIEVTATGTISTWPDIPIGCHIKFLQGFYTLSTHIVLAHKGTSIDAGNSTFTYTLDDADYAVKMGKAAGFSPGTATFSNGSTAVVWASGTDFSDLDPGDLIFETTGYHNVASVTDSHHLTLTAPFVGSTGPTAYGTYLQPTALSGAITNPVILKNLNILYNGAGTTAVGGVFANLITKPIITNVRMYNFTGNGWGLKLFGPILGEYSGIGAYYGKNGVLLDGGTVAGQVWGTNVSRFDSLDLFGNTTFGLVIDHGSNSSFFSSCHLEHNTAQKSIVVQGGSLNATFESCYFEGNGDASVNAADASVIGGADQITFRNSVHTTQTLNTPASGILVSGATDVTISGMTLSGLYTTCYNYTGGATGQTISNNCHGIAAGDPAYSVTSSGDLASHSIAINGTAAITGRTGTGGTVVMSTSPTLVTPTLTNPTMTTPTLGAAAATSITIGANTVPTVATPTVNQVACIKAAGPPVQIGYCTGAVSGTSSCTCN